MQQRFTVAEVAETYGVKQHTVLGWIKEGILSAIDVSRSRKRPGWRISEEAISAFEAARSTAADKTKPRKPRRKKPEGVIEWY